MGAWQWVSCRLKDETAEEEMLKDLQTPGSRKQDKSLHEQICWSTPPQKNPLFDKDIGTSILLILLQQCAKFQCNPENVEHLELS